jgi:hypothetical protein
MIKLKSSDGSVHTIEKSVTLGSLTLSGMMKDVKIDNETEIELPIKNDVLDFIIDIMKLPSINTRNLFQIINDKTKLNFLFELLIACDYLDLKFEKLDLNEYLVTNISQILKMYYDYSLERMEKMENLERKNDDGESTDVLAEMIFQDTGIMINNIHLIDMLFPYIILDLLNPCIISRVYAKIKFDPFDSKATKYKKSKLTNRLKLTVPSIGKFGFILDDNFVYPYGTIDDFGPPYEMLKDKKIKNVLYSLDSEILLLDDGSLHACGYMARDYMNIPKKVNAIYGFSDCNVACLLEDGSVWANTPHGTITLDSNETKFISVSVSRDHILCLSESGHIIGYGNNKYGQLNIPSVSRKYVSVSSGSGYSIGLLDNGTVIGWGRNNHGQINIPQIPHDRKFVSISAGRKHCLGLLDDGTLIGWGNNNNGVLNIPDKKFTHMIAGNQSTLAITTNGSIIKLGVLLYKIVDNIEMFLI